jgi:hypothetical protein
MNPVRMSSNLLYLTCIGLTFHITEASLPEANCAGWGYYTPEVIIPGPDMTCAMTADFYLGDYMNYTSLRMEECMSMIGPPDDQIPMRTALTYFQMYCCGAVNMGIPPNGLCGKNYDETIMCEEEGTFYQSGLLAQYHCQGDEDLPYERCQNEEAGIMAGDAWCSDCDDGQGECDVGRLDDERMPSACVALGGSWQRHTCMEMMMAGMQEQEECPDVLRYAGFQCCQYQDLTPAPPRCEPPGDDQHDDGDHDDHDGGMCAPITQDTVDRMRGWGYEPVFCASAR